LSITIITGVVNEMEPRLVGIRVPFIKKKVGLGTAIHELTKSVFRCGGCKKRAARLDQRVMLVPMKDR